MTRKQKREGLRLATWCGWTGYHHIGTAVVLDLSSVSTDACVDVVEEKFLLLLLLLLSLSGVNTGTSVDVVGKKLLLLLLLLLPLSGVNTGTSVDVVAKKLLLLLFAVVVRLEASGNVDEEVASAFAPAFAVEAFGILVSLNAMTAFVALVVVAIAGGSNVGAPSLAVNTFVKFVSLAAATASAAFAGVAEVVIVVVVCAIVVVKVVVVAVSAVCVAVWGRIMLIAVVVIVCVVVGTVVTVIVCQTLSALVVMVLLGTPRHVLGPEVKAIGRLHSLAPDPWRWHNLLT